MDYYPLVIGITGLVAGTIGLAIVWKQQAVESELDPVRAEWESVGKTADGRVDRDLFKKHCLAKHADKLTPKSTSVYEVFLDRVFDAGTALMLKPATPERTDLGRHCFSYCNVLAGEFYFQQAADAEANGSAACRCATPVADVLKLVPPKK